MHWIRRPAGAPLAPSRRKLQMAKGDKATQTCVEPWFAATDQLAARFGSPSPGQVYLASAFPLRWMGFPF
jgi:hypothetical protein